MRDQEAILKLKLLEKTKATDIESERVSELIGLASMFSQALVSSYIDMNKTNHTRVGELLLAAQKEAEYISVEKIVALAYASILFGGPVWISLPKMFNSIDPSKLEEVLSLLCPMIAIKFN
jgi:hypothetical protein